MLAENNVRWLQIAVHPTAIVGERHRFPDLVQHADQALQGEPLAHALPVTAGAPVAVHCDQDLGEGAPFHRSHREVGTAIRQRTEFVHRNDRRMGQAGHEARLGGESRREIRTIGEGRAHHLHGDHPIEIPIEGPAHLTHASAREAPQISVPTDAG